MAAPAGEDGRQLLMRSTLARVGRFGIVGGGVTLLNFLISLGLINGGIHYVFATSVGWVAGVVVSYFANKHFTFMRTGSPDVREVRIFLSAYLLQLLVGTASLVLLVEVARLPFHFAFWVNVGITAIVSYGLMDRVVFAPRSPG
jgi:putative flippase GtrA